MDQVVTGSNPVLSTIFVELIQKRWLRGSHRLRSSKNNITGTVPLTVYSGVASGSPGHTPIKREISLERVGARAGLDCGEQHSYRILQLEECLVGWK